MKKEITVGMRVEFVNGQFRLIGKVERAEDGIYSVLEIGTKHESRWMVHRRQITKTWRKKPKPLPMEYWQIEREDGTLLGSIIYRVKPEAPDGQRVVRFREVLE